MYSCLVVIYVMFLVVALVTMLYWSYSTVTNGTSHRTGTEWRAVSERSRMLQRCRLIPRQIPSVKGWWTPPPVHPPEDVPTCHRIRAERDGVGNSPRLASKETPRLDARADVPAIQLVGYKTSQGEIWELYNEVCQLKRLPSSPLCRPEQVQELAWAILFCLEEHLQQRWGCCHAGRRSRTGTHQDPHAPLMRWDPSKKITRWWLLQLQPCWGQGDPSVGAGGHPPAWGKNGKIEPIGHENKAGWLLALP